MTDPVSGAINIAPVVKLFVNTVAIEGFAPGKFVKSFNFGESFNVILSTDSPSVAMLRDVFSRNKSVPVNLVFTKDGMLDFTGQYVLTDVCAEVSNDGIAKEIDFNFIRERRNKERE